MANFYIEQHASKLVIVGELTRHSLTKKNHASMAPYLNGSNLVIDLSSVDKIDTAGLAWLLSIVESYTQYPDKLHFTHLSGELVKLAKLSSVDHYLPTLY